MRVGTAGQGTWGQGRAGAGQWQGRGGDSGGQGNGRAGQSRAAPKICMLSLGLCRLRKPAQSAAQHDNASRLTFQNQLLLKRCKCEPGRWQLPFLQEAQVVS